MIVKHEMSWCLTKMKFSELVACEIREDQLWEYAIWFALFRYTDIEAVRKFQFFFNGQKTLLEKLVNMAKVVNISRSDLQNYEPRAEAQGYPSHFCLLAHYGDAPQIAAAIAVNFPPFGEMCANIADALKENCSLK